MGVSTGRVDDAAQPVHREERARSLPGERPPRIGKRIPTLQYGLPIGALGALIVALFFLAVDVTLGRPLATPNALGLALFLGEPIDFSAPLQYGVIAGYTVIHGAVFVGMASIAAVLLLSAPRLPSRGVLFLGLLAALFVACQSVFLILSMQTGLSIWSELGLGRVAFANVLAAASMAALLERSATLAKGSVRPG